MAIRKTQKSSPKTPINPDIQKFQAAVDDVKKALDKRKGEKGLKGLSAARESFCEGAKYILRLLNDASFSEDSLKAWEKWCSDWCTEDSEDHQSMIDRAAFAKFLRLLFRAIISASLEPQFPEDSTGSTEDDATPPADVAVVSRIMRAVVAALPLVLDGHQVVEDGPADVKSDKKAAKSPYATRDWFELLLTLLEYAEGKGTSRPKETQEMIEVFQTLMSHNNKYSCKVWDTDPVSVRDRLGNLIMDSTVTTLSVYGLRTLIYSLPTKPHSNEDIDSARWKLMYPALNKHPRWQAGATQESTRAMRGFLKQVAYKPSAKPRSYMRMVNNLHNLDDADSPQAFPLAGCIVDGGEMMDNKASKGRLAEGEVIAYLDRSGMLIMDFSEFGREEPVALDDIHGRLVGLWRKDDPNRNRFEFRLLARSPGGEDRDYTIDIETDYADKFEAALKKLLPPSAWLETAHSIGVKRPSAPDNDSGELVPESSALPRNNSKQSAGANETETQSKVIESVVDLQRFPSHASDSFGLSSAPKGTKSIKSKSSGAVAAKPAARLEAIKDAEANEQGEAEVEEAPEGVEEQEEVEQPRRSTRSSGAAETSMSAAKSTGKTTTKAASKAPAKSTKAPAKSKGKPTSPKTADATSSVEEVAAEPPSELSVSAASGRPSRAAKTKGMQKSSGVISGEAVPLSKEVTKVTTGGRKGSAKNQGEEVDAGKGQEGEKEEVVEQEVAVAKKTPAKTKGKKKVPEIEDVEEVEVEPAEVEETEEAPEPKKVAAKSKGKSKVAAAAAEEEVDGEADAAAGEAVAVPLKVTTPAVLVPASSQQVPVTKPNTISRSRQRYSRDKPASTKKTDESEPESEPEPEAEDDPADDFEDNIIPNPPTTKKAPSTKSSTASKADPKPKTTFKPPAPVVAPRVSLRATKPKATIAGEIESGRAMTPAAVHAKAAAAALTDKSAASVEKSGKNGKGKSKAAEKKAEKKGWMGPPKGVLEDKAASAPGRVEDVNVFEDSVGGGGAEEAEEGGEDEAAVVKGKAGARKVVPKRGKQAASPPKDVAEEDGEQVPAGKASRAKKDKVVPLASAKSPAQPAASPIKKRQTASKAPAPPAAIDQREPEPEPEVEVVDVEAEAEPASQPDSQPAASNIEADPIARRSPSPPEAPDRQPSPEKPVPAQSRPRAQAAHVSPASDHEPDALPPPRKATARSAAGKTAVVSDSVDPAEEQAAIPNIHDDVAEAEVERVATPPAPAVKAATAAGNKRKADENDQPDKSPRKRTTPKRVTIPLGQIETNTPAQRRPEPVIPAPKTAPVQATPARTGNTSTSRRAPVDDIPPVEEVDERPMVAAKKRKVSIDEPEVQVKKVRRVEGGDGGRREKGDGKSRAVERVMNTIDGISETVKRRIQERLAIPDKVISAIERHVTKAACKAVDAFGTDHDATYQALSAQMSNIHIKQSDLQTQYKTHTATAKAQHRQVCDLFKLYKRPMEGIPIALFE